MTKDYTLIKGSIGYVFGSIVNEYSKTNMLDRMNIDEIKAYVKKRITEEATKSSTIPIKRVIVTLDRIYTKPQVISFIYNSYLCDCGMSSTGIQVSKRKNDYRIF